MTTCTNTESKTESSILSSVYEPNMVTFPKFRKDIWLCQDGSRQQIFRSFSEINGYLPHLIKILVYGFSDFLILYVCLISHFDSSIFL